MKIRYNEVKRCGREMLGFVSNMERELAQFKITVNAVGPTPVKTFLTAKVPKPWWKQCAIAFSGILNASRFPGI